MLTKFVLSYCCQSMGLLLKNSRRILWICLSIWYFDTPVEIMFKTECIFVCFGDKEN